MTTRTSAGAKQAFKRFVDLVKPIKEVRCVMVFDQEELDIYTYIEDLDEAVMSRVHQVEILVMDEFPTLLVDFHVRYIERRPLEAVVQPKPALTYRRENHGHRQEKAES